MKETYDAPSVRVIMIKPYRSVCVLPSSIDGSSIEDLGEENFDWTTK